MSSMRGYILYMWLGVWLFLLPFLGIPGNWKDGLLILTALFIVANSFIGYRRTRLAHEVESEIIEVAVISEEKPSEEV